MNHDRRQHPRFIPDSALLVSLGQSKRGFLKDVSESGMAFDGFLHNSGNNVIYLTFDLPDEGGAIEAVAEIVWTCESLHRTGVRFLELADASRRQLRHWISARVFTLGKASEEGKNIGEHSAVDSQAVLPAMASPLSPDSVRDLTPDLKRSEPVPGPTVSSRKQKKAQPEILAARKIIRVPHAPVSVGVALVILFVSTACISLGYYLPGLILGRGPAPVTSPLSATFTAPVASNSSGGALVAVNHFAVNHVAANQSAAATPSIAAAKPSTNEIASGAVNETVAVSAPAASGGFVLQVAAMSQAVNAAKLIEKLRQKNFPAFLPDRGGNALYRVEVGPYEDIDYARTVEGDLKSAGFSAILRHRSAQPDSN